MYYKILDETNPVESVMIPFLFYTGWDNVAQPASNGTKITVSLYAVSLHALT